MQTEAKPKVEERHYDEVVQEHQPIAREVPDVKEEIVKGLEDDFNKLVSKLEIGNENVKVKLPLEFLRPKERTYHPSTS